MNEFITPDELGNCDTCNAEYDLSSREGRCGDCGDCALHCQHTTPCDNCGKPVPSDIHAEELGFCLPCSNKYWEHKPMDGGDCEHLIVLETGDKFYSEYLRKWLTPVACVDCGTAWDWESETLEGAN